MYKNLAGDRGCCSGGTYVFQCHFPGQVDSAYTQVLPEQNSFVVNGVRLGREMQFALGGDTANHPQDAGIADNVGIKWQWGQLEQVRFKLLQVMIRQIAVDRQVATYSVVMTKLECGGHLFQAEVASHIT